MSCSRIQERVESGFSRHVVGRRGGGGANRCVPGIRRGWFTVVDWLGPYPEIRGKVPAKKLWDWLGLLLVPIASGIGGAWLSWTQMRNDQAGELERFRESVLHKCLDQITGLVLSADLNEWTVREIGPARTLAAPSVLDGERTGFLLLYLSDSMLITVDKDTDAAKIDLQCADFSEAELEGAFLADAMLELANFGNGNLRRAAFMGAGIDGQVSKERT